MQQNIKLADLPLFGFDEAKSITRIRSTKKERYSFIVKLIVCEERPTVVYQNKKFLACLYCPVNTIEKLRAMLALYSLLTATKNI